MTSATISKRGAERIRNGHPWIYRSDVVSADAAAGDVVRVVDHRGRVAAHALYSDRSEIVLRVLTRGEEPPTLDTWRRRLEQAIAFRRRLAIDATAYRLVHGEADLLPSLVVDRYGDWLVLQALSQTVDRMLPDITRLLVEIAAPVGILARNDPKVRQLEGLEQRVEVLYGDVPETIDVREGRVVYRVDPYRGQKTGLFLDQRENRAAAAQYASGRLLDAFSYNGGFALTLAPHCREVIAVDISESAVARIRENAAANGLTNVEVRLSDGYRDLAGQRFDVVLSNLPAHRGQQADSTVAHAFIAGAPAHLRPGGAAWFVANKALPLELPASRAFRRVSIAAADGRYKVLHCEDPVGERHR